MSKKKISNFKIYLIFSDVHFCFIKKLQGFFFIFIDAKSAKVLLLSLLVTSHEQKWKFFPSWCLWWVFTFLNFTTFNLNLVWLSKTLNSYSLLSTKDSLHINVFNFLTYLYFSFRGRRKFSFTLLIAFFVCFLLRSFLLV